MGERSGAAIMNKKKPPTIEQYIKMPAILIRSPALRNLPLYAFRVVLAVMDELNRSGGKGNGNLIVPYSTLKLWLGTSNKNTIALAIEQAEVLGFIAVARGYVAKDGTKVPNRFRITWLPGHNRGPATDEWKDVTSDEHAKAILGELKRRRPQTEEFKAAKADGQLKTKWRNPVNKSSVHAGDTDKQISSANSKSSSVHTGVTETDKSSVHTGDTGSVHTGRATSVHTGVTEKANSGISVGTHGGDTYLDICPSVEPGASKAVARRELTPPAKPPVAPRPAAGRGASINGHNGAHEPENGNGANLEPAARSKMAPWVEDDTAWFRTAPRRRYRLRKLFEGEDDDLGVEDTEATYVVVGMTEDGRERLTAVWPGTILQDLEEVAHAMFDLAMTGSPFTRTQLAELIQLYRQETQYG
jgi:hypothetical protein